MGFPVVTFPQYRTCEKEHGLNQNLTTHSDWLKICSNSQKKVVIKHLLFRCCFVISIDLMNKCFYKVTLCLYIA